METVVLEYYTLEDIRNIEKANSYAHLLGIAINVISRVQDKNPATPIAMVCGPISTGGKGSREKNLEIFDKAIKRLSNGGLLVFSQMPFEDSMGRIFNSNPELQGDRLLEEFYLPIFKLGLVKILCFLPGWTNSIGATWEHHQAEKLNIARIYLSNYYVSDFNLTP